MKLRIFFLGHLLFVSAPALALPTDNGSEGPESPSKSNITWAPCKLNLTYSGAPEGRDAFDCARHTVPLDYTKKESGEIQLDLIRIRASKKPTKGSILYNPGGPGASGVERVASGGRRYLNVTGGHYDVIGFDPRGTGRTIPFHCNSSASSSLARRESNTLPHSDIWDYLKGAGWKASSKFAQDCYSAQEDYGRYIGTPFVARDMLSMVDALGQGRLLNYWGASYGTVLGQIFVSMFPDRVGRVLLDANILADDYLTSTWIGSTRDTEKGLLHLFNECVEAGPKYCSLAEYAGGNTTGRALMNALNKAMKESKDWRLPEELGDSVVLLKDLIAASLQTLESLPDAIALVEMVLNISSTGDLDTGSDAENTSTPAAPWNKGTDALLGIKCSDSSFRVQDPDDLYSIYQAHLSQSSFSDVAAKKQLPCAQWKFSAAEQVDTNTLRNINTSFPVLLVNGKYDPLAPASYAWEVSARLRNSRVIIHEGAGHGITAHESTCVEEAVGKYFTDGDLPKVGTVCKPVESVSEYLVRTGKKVESEDETDEGN